MNRETELHFAELPQINRPRSRFIMPFGHKTTFNAGKLIPIYVSEILPGDSVKMKMANVIRMSTPLFPTMDELAADITFFYVPTRLLWTHWREFWGENKNAWYQSTEYEVPQIKTSDMYKFKENSLADYMGLPLETSGLSVSALPFRAVVKIFNDWWRDENLEQELPNVDTDSDAYTDEDYAYLGGAVPTANKVHDYFTSSLPAPLKNGSEVLLPLGNLAPVYATETPVPTLTNNTYLKPANRESLIWSAWKDNTNPFPADKHYDLFGTSKALGNKLNTRALYMDGNEKVADELTPNNLWTDLTQATAATISQIRQAFAVQRFYEAQARGGSRYIEFIKNIFGVTSPDARLQRSEYLGGRRVPLKIMQVAQQSATTETSPLGQTGGFSHTADQGEFFSKSFTEHGYIIGLCCVRQTSRTYAQGINRMWSRRKWYDYYVPQFANLSEQGVKLKEIYAQGTAEDETVFGYQEAWAEYRYMPNIVSSSMRPNVSNTLAAWNYADNYEAKPVLGSTWIKENKDNIDRTLAVTSAIANQFIADFYFKPTYVRPMPMYSLPGLIDHM